MRKGETLRLTSTDDLGRRCTVATHSYRTLPVARRSQKEVFVILTIDVVKPEDTTKESLPPCKGVHESIVHILVSMAIE